MGKKYCAVPQELTGLQLCNQQKSGKGEVSFLKTPFLKVTFPSSAPPPGWAGVFSCPYMVKLGPQITVFYVQRACPGIINLLSSLERMWVSCHHCFIVLEHVLCFCCLLLLLSKSAFLSNYERTGVSHVFSTYNPLVGLTV